MALIARLVSFSAGVDVRILVVKVKNSIGIEEFVKLYNMSSYMMILKVWRLQFLEEDLLGSASKQIQRRHIIGARKFYAVYHDKIMHISAFVHYTFGHNYKKESCLSAVK